MSIEIKPMTIEHYDEVLALWQSVEGVGINDADTRGNMARYFERNRGLSFIAVSGNRIVGAVLCGHDGRRGYLNHLAVAHEFRRQGVGRTLVESCLAELRNQGILKCNIMVFDNNESGLMFWDNSGWVKQPWLLLQKPTCGNDTSGGQC